MERIYISGPISGVPNYMENFNEVEKQLEDKYYVLNPARMMSQFDDMDFHWKEYMDIAMVMLNACDIVYMLKDWENSKGAIVEYYYALGCKKPVVFQEPKENLIIKVN